MKNQKTNAVLRDLFANKSTRGDLFRKFAWAPSACFFGNRDLGCAESQASHRQPLPRICGAQVESKEDLDRMVVQIRHEQANKQSLSNDYGYETRTQLLARYTASEVEVLTRPDLRGVSQLWLAKLCL